MLKVKSFDKYPLYNAADIVFSKEGKEGLYKVEWGCSILTDVCRYRFEKIGREGERFEYEEMMKALNRFYATTRQKGEALRGAHVKVPQKMYEYEEEEDYFWIAPLGKKKKFVPTGGEFKSKLINWLEVELEGRNYIYDGSTWDKEKCCNEIVRLGATIRSF